MLCPTRGRRDDEPHQCHTLAGRVLLVASITTNVHALALSNAAKRIMRAAVYDPAAPQGARLVERAAPKPAKRCCRGVVLCEVRSCGANPVDAKYVIGDKFPESWLPWASRRVAGSTPGFDFSGVVIQAPAGSGFATGDEVARMPCGHEFRRDALGTWLKNHSTCPVCRHQLKVGSAMAEAIAEAGGLANIEALQQHSDSDIYVKARRLIEAFFST